MNSFGSKLKAERERQGYDLDAAADATKIRKLYLSALEEEDFGKLPARVYAIGFVTTYARFLKMDIDAAVQEFKGRAYPEKPQPQAAEVPQKAGRQRRRKPFSVFEIPGRNILTAVLFLLIIWWLGTYVAAYISGQAVNKHSDSLPVLEVQAPEVVPVVVPEPELPDPAADQTAQGLHLIIDAREQCWLAVTVDGIRQFEGMIAAGEQQSYQGREAISIRAGNAGGIDLTINGRKMNPLGENGQVVDKKFDLTSINGE